jgi:hypothetical protein
VFILLSVVSLLVSAGTLVLWLSTPGSSGHGVGVGFPHAAFGVLVHDGRVWAGGEIISAKNVEALVISREDESILSTTHSFAGFGVLRDRSAAFMAIPCWCFILIATALGVFGLTRRPHPSIGCCRVCGYDLRATPGRCPECGTTAKTAESNAC